MIKNILKIGGIILLAILEITLMPNLGLKGLWPNLILVAALALILLDFGYEALLVASLGGLVLDFASPLFFGFNMLIIISFVLITKFLLTKYLAEPNILIVGIFIGFASIFNDVISMLVVRNFIFWPILLNACYSGLAGILFYRFFEQWFKRQKFTNMVIQ